MNHIRPQNMVILKETLIMVIDPQMLHVQDQAIESTLRTLYMKYFLLILYKLQPDMFGKLY